MIQRIQSIYLLLVTVLLILAICLPIGHFISSEGLIVGTLTPVQYSQLGGTHETTWGLLVILLLASLISFLTIFLFKNRLLQIRMVVFSSLLIIGYYIACIFFVVVLKENYEGFRMNWSLGLPLVALILNYLAFRSIYRDEIMVKAADRLR